MKIKNPQTGEVMEYWDGIAWVSPTRAEWKCPGCGKAMGLDFEEGRFEEAIPEGQEDGLYLYCDDCRPAASSKIEKFMDYAKKLHGASTKYRLDRYDGPAIDCKKDVGELRDGLVIWGQRLPTDQEVAGQAVHAQILGHIRSMVDAYVFKPTELQDFVDRLRSLKHVRSVEADEDGTVTAVVETPMEILTVRVPGWRLRMTPDMVEDMSEKVQEDILKMHGVDPDAPVLEGKPPLRFKMQMPDGEEIPFEKGVEAKKRVSYRDLTADRIVTVEPLGKEDDGGLDEG